jgi:hypothetical protein
LIVALVVLFLLIGAISLIVKRGSDDNRPSTYSQQSGGHIEFQQVAPPRSVPQSPSAQSVLVAQPDVRPPAAIVIYTAAAIGPHTSSSSALPRFD